MAMVVFNKLIIPVVILLVSYIQHSMLCAARSDDLAAAASSSCTAPHKPEASLKPYCYVASNLSPEAQDFLRSSAAGPKWDVSTAQKRKELRAVFDDFNANVYPGVTSEYLQQLRNHTIAGLPCVLGTPYGFKPDGPTQGKLMIYLLGGAYVMGECTAQLSTVAAVAKDAQLQVLCINYRQAPEHPFPSGLDDAVAVYKALISAPSQLSPKQYKPKDIVLIGDSAGGGLCIALLLKLQQLKLPLPAATAVYAPWVELSKTGDTYTTLSGVDPFLQYELQLQGPALAYVAGDKSKMSNPLVSPVRASFSKADIGTLPPILIQIGTRDILLSSNIQLFRKLKEAGQPVEFSPWEGMFHVFEAFLKLPEARKANAETAAFFKQHLGLAA